MEDKNSSPMTSASQSQDKAATNRIKRMRNWLGMKGESSWSSFDEDNDAPVYGDGHSGWNR